MALVAAAVILFQQPLRYVLDFAQDIEARYHLDLIPALLLLVAVFVIHQYRKRDQARGEALAAATEAAQARQRSEDLERLMSLGRSLADALDRSTLQQVLWRHLPTFVLDRPVWVMVPSDEDWDVFIKGESSDGVSDDTLSRLAAQAVAGSTPVGATAAPDTGEHAMFPMSAAGTTVGVLIVGNAGARTPLTADERTVVGAAAALIAIAVKNVQLFAQTKELSLRDALTGCFNHAHALETLEGELRRSRRSQGPLSILMFDIDHFKTVNDEFGHLRGDELLREVAARLQGMVRSTDVRCRFGGDEFLVILTDTPVLGAQQVAETIRLEMAKIVVSAGDRQVGVTISAGVAAALPAEMDPKALIGRADEALYRAKRGGRDRFCVAFPPAGTSAMTA